MVACAVMLPGSWGVCWYETGRSQGNNGTVLKAGFLNRHYNILYYYHYYYYSILCPSFWHIRSIQFFSPTLISWHLPLHSNLSLSIFTCNPPKQPNQNMPFNSKHIVRPPIKTCKIDVYWPGLCWQSRHYQDTFPSCMNMLVILLPHKVQRWHWWIHLEDKSSNSC